MNENPAFTQALQDLGMTKTEAEVYLATLQTSLEEPVSGYKVAQVMGRDPANLSKTLAHLVKVGAVRLVQARPRHYLGVPVTEFTEMLMARMEESREKAITLMASLGSRATSQQPMPVENTSHIFAQARKILSQSRGNVLLCCDGKTLQHLEEFLVDMGQNFPGLAKVFSDSDRKIPGITVYCHDGSFPMNTGFAENTTENWLLLAANNGQWISAFYDLGDSAENTTGWVGSNHEISLPVKTVIGALLESAVSHAGTENTEGTPELEDPVPADKTMPPEKELEVLEKPESNAMTFEAGAEASFVANPESISLPDEEAASENEAAAEPGPEEGFKFIVQHEDDDEGDLDSAEGKL